MTRDDDLKSFVLALLPFNEDKFKAALTLGDDIAMGAAAAGSFVAAVHSQTEIFDKAAARQQFCLALSGADYFAGRLPPWIVEATVQGALGRVDAVIDIPPATLVEIHVMGLKELSALALNPSDLALLTDEAIRNAQKIVEMLA